MWYRLVGTSHIAAESRKRIKEAFEEFEPDAIAVELDQQRLASLLAGARPSYSPLLIGRVGLRGYLFSVVGSFVQRRLGRVVNVAPGDDMLAAARLARRKGVRLLLIDQDVRVTLRRLSKALGWRELGQFCRDLWEGLWGGERVRVDLRRVPDEQLVARLLGEFRKRYPRPYRALVTERNRHMATALEQYHEHHPEQRILVVVGAGHAGGMNELLSKKLSSIKK